MDEDRRQISGVSRILRLLRWGAIASIMIWASVVAFDIATGARFGGPLAQSFVRQIAGRTQNASLVADRARTIQFDPRSRPLPSFHFVTPDDTSLTLKKFRGQIVLLNFWATWCAPCRREMPTLDRHEAQLGSPAFVIVPVSIDHGRPAAVSNLVKQFYATADVTHLGIYLEPDDNVIQRLGVEGIPTTLLIDKNGESIGRTVGAAVWDTPRMISLLRGVIAGTRPTHYGR